MDIFENLSKDIQSHYGNIDHFLNVELKNGIDKMNKETLDRILELFQQAEKIPNNIIDSFKRTDSIDQSVYNPYSD
jgi:hypothetical protein